MSSDERNAAMGGTIKLKLVLVTPRARPASCETLEFT